ncbi:hypothetical protein PPROV_000376800 [Pycnococcus provasolii]|uniref:Coenzyme Q-binding protein COQ10 START domain-containing protein n=1 Tax=Pycnococcus provasolii TaxID=41880 RepID=A0A7R9SXG2_9CHLO|nr:hypothetical protein PPROV_000376800 [Pycnococcus provasolii]|mmetsp:Transcript_2849/g.6395  ORF Transcript_2849/g.6395 Transcript_2849/m.6395 type:complete len:258 (+) Transcript_2849:1-774(+)
MMMSAWMPRHSHHQWCCSRRGASHSLSPVCHHHHHHQHRRALPLTRLPRRSQSFLTSTSSSRLSCPLRLAAAQSDDARTGDVATASPTATSPTLETTTTSDVPNGMYSATGKLVLPHSVNADDVWDMLLDYERSSDIFHNIEEAVVMHDESRNQKQLVEQCRWVFLVFSGTFELLLDVDENVSERVLTFSLGKPGAFMQAFEGRWQVMTADDGQAVVAHTLTVRPSLPPPALVSGYTEAVFERQVKRVMEDLRNALL